MTESELKKLWQKNEADAAKVKKGICPRAYASLAQAKEDTDRERTALLRYWDEIVKLRAQGLPTDYEKVERIKKELTDFLKLPWGINVRFELFDCYDYEGVDVLDGVVVVAAQRIDGYEPMTEETWKKIAKKMDEHLRQLRLVCQEPVETRFGPHGADGRSDAPNYYWATWIVSTGAWVGPYAEMQRQRGSRRSAR